MGMQYGGHAVFTQEGHNRSAPGQHTCIAQGRNFLLKPQACPDFKSVIVISDESRSYIGRARTEESVS